MGQYVEFPGLGLKFALPDTALQFSLFGLPITVKWYGVMIACGFLLAAIYAWKRAKSFKIDEDAMFDVVLVSTICAFVGARLYYVLFSPDRAAYFADPASIFRVWEGGLAIYGGLIFAFLSGLVMCRIRKVNTLAMFDLCSLGFLIGQAIGRWGNFFNQEAFGGNTTLPWGMTGNLIKNGVHATSVYNWAQPVHPTFLYESLWCVLGFVLLHLISVKAYTFKGKLFAGYLIWYGAGRFFIESLRIDSLKLGSMRVSQLVAVLAVAGGVALWLVCKNKAKNAPPEEETDDTPTVPLAEAAQAEEKE